MSDDGFVFQAIILQEDAGYTALCLDVDVASQGDPPTEAREALLEAVTLYLETAVESHLPWLRPVPPSHDPRFLEPDRIVAEFPLHVHKVAEFTDLITQPVGERS